MTRALATIVGLAIVLVTGTASAHNECREVSDVVGEKRCGHYGDGWSGEKGFRLMAGVGLWTSGVTPLGRGFAGKTTKKGPTEYRFGGSDLGLDNVQSYGFDMRVHGFVTPAMYLGFDWGFGVGAANPKPVSADGWTLTGKSGVTWIHVKAAPVIGVRIPLGYVSLRLESLVGIEIIGLAQHATNASGETSKGDASNVRFLLEPRAAVDVWTGPWSTLSLWGGMNALSTSDRTFGLSIAIHARPYDGKFSF